MIKITFPDGNTKEFKKRSTGREIADNISEGLGRAALAIKFNDELIDLNKPLETNGTIQIITFKDPEGIDTFRHSSAHLLAHAVKNLYPKANPTIGPVVEQGFYYDFENLSISTDDFPKIEEEMKKIINYCDNNKLPYTECPRYIRINQKAISIEIKKL